MFNTVAIGQTEVSGVIFRQTPPVLAIVLPCYNEQEVLPETFRRLRILLADLIERAAIHADSCAWLVDDGSRDATWRLISGASTAPGSPFRGIKLSRNRGHQIALLAGLMSASGDVLISVDADLQDDLNVIPTMLREFATGHDIVYGVRSDRPHDSRFKRTTAAWFYSVMRWLGADSLANHADYRLMSRRSIEALKLFGEVNLFLRGLVPLIGFRSAIVEYERQERFAGSTKYPVRKMVSLALDAITSFSIVPLRLITAIGFTVFAFSAAMVAWTLWVRFFSHEALPGWTSTTLPIYLLGGLQILCLGVIGEYLGKMYREAKHRPRYIIEKCL